MEYTTNLNLKKPAYSDPADIADMNGNMDKIDGAVADYAELETTEVAYDTIQDKMINSAGAIVKVSGSYGAYYLVKSNVIAGQRYLISASTKWSNSYYAFYDSSDGVLEVEPSGSASATKIEDREVTAPANSSYILIGCVSSEGDAEIAQAQYKVVGLSNAINDIERIDDVLDDIAEEYFAKIIGVETQNKFVTKWGTIIDAGTDQYRIITYPVTPNNTYKITASANYGNAYFAFYDSDMTLVSVGDIAPSGSAFTVLNNKTVIAPANAAFVVVNYHSATTTASCYEKAGSKIKGKWSNIKWVCVGDSLTEENARTSKHYFDYIAEKTGISVVNMGVSGTGYARRYESDLAFYQRISSIDTTADVVTIFGSFNDLSLIASMGLGNVNDTEPTTIAGCINKTISNLQAVMPTVKLGIVSPTPWDTTQPSTSGNSHDYVEMIKAICEHRSIPFLDLWRCSNLRPWDADFRELAYSKDGGSGTHPDENGHKLIAPRFKAFLESLIM